MRKKAEDAKMERLYREHVLGEKRIQGFVPVDGLLGSGIKPAAPAPVEKQEEVGAMGD